MSLFPTLLLVLLAACGPQEAPKTAATAPTAGGESVLVTVNGVPIHQEDVEYATSRADHSKTGASTLASKKAALDTVIRQELVYQKGVGLGLDKDPGYQAKVRAIDARASAEKRQAMADLFYRQEINKKAEVTEADAQKYFEENKARLSSEYHVLQILSRSEAEIQQAQASLKAGGTFEQVAATLAPKAKADARRSWDLGFVKWIQLPEEWQTRVDALPLNQPSDIIAGENGRFWIIQVVEKRERPDITFEASKKGIMTALQRDRAQELREAAFADLKSSANIVQVNEIKVEAEE